MSDETDPATGAVPSTGRDQAPLIPGLDDPTIDRLLRENLRTLRQVAGDESVRQRIDDVLAGRATLLDLSRDGAFGEFISPLAARGYERFEALPEDMVEELAAQGRAAAARLEQRDAAGGTEESDSGTW
jgi:hypothetical protein